MNPIEIMRIVDSIHREKNIDKEIVFQAIEAALVSAAMGYFGEDAQIEFVIDRENGEIAGTHDGEAIDAAELIGRVGAQRAKQVIIQKIREAERDALFEEYDEQRGQMLSGVIQRNEGGAATVSLKNVEAILPRSEQIPGESHHPNERVRAVVFEVRKQGSRVKVVLSRNRRELVARLFEQEIPEIAEGVITVEAISREPGYRSKVAVQSSDQRVDCVGACVGVRGNRIKNIVDELAGERIDIVRFDEDPQALIPNALQPAEVDEVILCQMLGRAIVLVREDQLSLAIGRRGQNVRLASKLCGWDIEIMTQEELESQINLAVASFSEIKGIDEDLANRLVGEGYLSYDDLEVIEPDDLAEMGELTEEQVNAIVEQAEEKAKEAALAAAEQRRRQKENEKLEAEAAKAKQQAEAEAAANAETAEATEEAATEEEATEGAATEEEATEEEEEAAEEAATEEEATEEEATEEEATEEEVTEEEATEEEATEEEATEEEAAAGEATEEAAGSEEAETEDPETGEDNAPGEPAEAEGAAESKEPVIEKSEGDVAT